MCWSCSAGVIADGCQAFSRGLGDTVACETPLVDGLILDTWPWLRRREGLGLFSSWKTLDLIAWSAASPVQLDTR